MDLKDSNGFTTPPTVSVDTCDSGFTEYYCNSVGGRQMNESRKNLNGNGSSGRRHLSNDSSSNSGESNLSTTTDFGGVRCIAISGDDGSESSVVANRYHVLTESASFDQVTTMEGDKIFLQILQTTDDCDSDNDDRSDDDNVSDGGNSTRDTDQDENEEQDDDEDDDDNDEDDEDDSDETSSNLSNLSDLSDVLKMNASAILPEIEISLDWVNLQIASGVKPRDCLSRVLMNSSLIPANLSDNDLWRIIATMLTDPPRRDRLHSICTIFDVVELLRKSMNILVLTGAGVSVSCGIPDFRSRSGIYSRLRQEFPEMIDPQSMFDIRYFYQDPRPFYKFAKEIYPGLFKPSPCHRFIRLLEQKRKLLRNYSQNIDTLERVAEIENVIECHGSFATASCTKCQYKVTSDVIKSDILAQKIPLCPLCNPTIATTVNEQNDIMDHHEICGRGIMKPDIVFFGESMPDEFHTTAELDKFKCDLLIVIGSSLKVRPVALIPSSLPPNVPQILINREQLDNFGFDVELLGDSDVIINQLCWMLGDDWRNEVCWQPPLQEATELILRLPPSPPPSSSSSLSLSSDPFTPVSIYQNQLESAVIPTTINNDHRNDTTTSNLNFTNLTLNSSCDSSNDNSNTTTAVSSIAISTNESQTSKAAPPLIIDTSTSNLCNSKSIDHHVSENKIDPLSFTIERINSKKTTIANASSATDTAPYATTTGPSATTTTTTSNTIKNTFKPRHSITKRLPPNSYYHDPPNIYIFPGAEIWLDESDTTAICKHLNSNDDGVGGCNSNSSIDSGSSCSSHAKGNDNDNDNINNIKKYNNTKDALMKYIDLDININNVNGNADGSIDGTAAIEIVTNNVTNPSNVKNMIGDNNFCWKHHALTTNANGDEDKKSLTVIDVDKIKHKRKSDEHIAAANKSHYHTTYSSTKNTNINSTLSTSQLNTTQHQQHSIERTETNSQTIQNHSSQSAQIFKTYAAHTTVIPNILNEHNTSQDKNCSEQYSTTGKRRKFNDI